MGLGFDELCWALFDSDERKCLLLSLYGGANKRRGAVAQPVEDDYQIVCRRRRPHRAYRTYLGIGQRHFGNVVDPEAAMRKSLRLSMQSRSHDPELYQWLGLVSAEKGKYQEALDYFRRASKFVDQETGERGFGLLHVSAPLSRTQKSSLFIRKLCGLLLRRRQPTC